jgi:putative MATE family efflux protein
VNNSQRLGKENILKLIITMSIPGVVSMGMQALYNVVDSIFVGRLGEMELSALSIAFPLQMVLIAIGVGTGVGTSSVISRYLGEGQDKKAEKVSNNVVLLSILYGTIFGYLGLFHTRDIMSIFTDNPELIEMSTRYSSIILTGSIAIFIPMISNNILRGQGNTFLPMISMLIGSIINIILDPIMIYGLMGFPRMGIEGAAYATVIARIFSGTFIILKVISGKNHINVSLKKLRINYKVLTPVFQVGLPAMIMQLLASVMIAGMNKIVGSMSLVAIGSLGIYFRLQSFVFMPVFGLNQAYMPIIGYNFGAHKFDRMKEAIKYAMIIAFIFTASGFLLFQLASKQLIELFNSSSELKAVGIPMLKRASLMYPIVGPAIIGSVTFQGIGKGMPSLFLSILRQIVILLPVCYLFSLTGNLNNVWYCFPISDLAATVITFIWLKRTLGKLEI